MLTAAGVIKGSPAPYPAVAPEATGAGGVWVDVAMGKAHVDRSLVTAPAWQAHPAWLAQRANHTPRSGKGRW